MTNGIDRPFHFIDKAFEGLTRQGCRIDGVWDLTMKKIASLLAAAAAFVAIPQVTAAADVDVPTYDQSAKCAAIDTVMAVIFEDGTPSEEDKASAKEMNANAQKWTILALAQAPGDENAVADDITTRGTTLLTKMASASGEDEIMGIIGADMIECLTYEAILFKAES